MLLGYAQLGSESGWRVGLSQSVKEAALRRGIKLRFENAEQKQEKQIDALRSFIAYQVDVIAISPIVEDGWDAVLTEAREAGIPVILVDRKIDVKQEGLYATFIGSDFVEEGRAAARFLKQKTQGMDRVHIVELQGTLDATPMRDRGLGFREELADDPRFVIVDSVSGDFLRSKGKEGMKGLLSRNPKIDALFSHNDGMTLGAVEAIEAAGLSPGEDIIIMTVDGEQAAIDLLKQGKVNCVVECTPLLGDHIMDLALALSRGEEVPPVVHSTETVFTEFDRNLDALPPRGY